MRYYNQEVSNELAKHYVIGTMVPLVRRRFKKLMVRHSHLQQAVWHWEQLLNPMAEELAPIEPEPQVWQGITARLGWNTKTKQSSWWTISGWLATAASLLLVTYLWTTQPVISPQQPQALAILQVDQAQPAWVLQQTANTLSVTVKTLPDIKSDQDFELWMLPSNGRAPISLGLLPKSGNKDLTVSSQLTELIQSGLAVSIEPENGSPTGAPTGPIILTAQWIEVKI